MQASDVIAQDINATIQILSLLGEGQNVNDYPLSWVSLDIIVLCPIYAYNYYYIYVRYIGDDYTDCAVYICDIQSIHLYWSK